MEFRGGGAGGVGGALAPHVLGIYLVNLLPPTLTCAVCVTRQLESRVFLPAVSSHVYAQERASELSLLIEQKLFEVLLLLRERELV